MIKLHHYECNSGNLRWVKLTLLFLQCITVFARSDAAATIHFIAQFCVATIRERRLYDSSDYTRAATISFSTAGHC